MPHFCPARVGWEIFTFLLAGLWRAEGGRKHHLHLWICWASWLTSCGSNRPSAPQSSLSLKVSHGTGKAGARESCYSGMCLRRVALEAGVPTRSLLLPRVVFSRSLNLKPHGFKLHPDRCARGEGHREISKAPMSLCPAWVPCRAHVWLGHCWTQQLPSQMGLEHLSSTKQ